MPVEGPILPGFSLKRLVSVVAEHYRVTPADILSQRRSAHIVRPRHIVFYLCTVMTNWSLPHIGRRLGGRDHTTVLHGARKIEDEREDNLDLASTLAALEAKARS